MEISTSICDDACERFHVRVVTMHESQPQPVTQILRRAGEGDPAASAELLPLVYEQLRELARARMVGERADHTFQPTALVHEAYLRLVGDGNGEGWANRAHFFAAAAQAMRRILIEHARANGRQKRGGGAKRAPVDLLELAAAEDSEQILAVDEAIRRLEEDEPEVGAVVRMRFFAGLSVAETAAALGVSERSVYRDWTYARAWLIRELGEVI